MPAPTTRAPASPGPWSARRAARRAGPCRTRARGRLGQQEAGVREAVTHLLNHGHQRIAYVAGPADLVHSGLRRAAFESALAEAGLRPVAVRHTDFTEEAAVTVTAELLARPDRPTALVFPNDSMAVCGMGAAQRAGLRVPRTSPWSATTTCRSPVAAPRLTTVDQQVQRVGAAAALTLLTGCGEEVPAPFLDGRPRLVVRESTGLAPPAGHDAHLPYPRGPPRPQPHRPTERVHREHPRRIMRRHSAQLTHDHAVLPWLGANFWSRTGGP